MLIVVCYIKGVTETKGVCKLVPEANILDTTGIRMGSREDFKMRNLSPENLGT